MSISSWVDNQIVIYPSNRILFSNKKEHTTNTSNNVDDSQNGYTSKSIQIPPPKKTNKQEYTLDDFSYIGF